MVIQHQYKQSWTHKRHLRPILFLDTLYYHIWLHASRMGLSCYFYSRLSFHRTFVWLPNASPPLLFASDCTPHALGHDSDHAKSHQQASDRRRGNLTPLVYKPTVTSLVAPSNRSSWLNDLVWLFQSAEITAAKITFQTSCSGPVFGPSQWSKPLNRDKIFFL